MCIKSDTISSFLDQLHRTCCNCACAFTWCHQPVDASLSAFPAGWSGIAPRAVHYPGDPLSQSRLGRPDRWHTTLGYRQTEEFKTHTQRKDYTTVRFTPPRTSAAGSSGDWVCWQQHCKTTECIKYVTDVQCHRVSIAFFCFVYAKLILAPTHSTQLVSVCD